MRQTHGAGRHLILGFLAIALLGGTLGAWSIGTQIAGAVLASGTVQVESDRQVIQHPDGGVVGEILARDGDSVAPGDVLVRLDGTFLRSELVIVERQLAEIFARRTRLVAERDAADTLDPVDAPVFAIVTPEQIAAQIEGQRDLFLARRTALGQQQNQLAEQQAQIGAQIDGARAQLTALERQQQLIGEELADVQTLFDRGLMQASRLLELQREEARLQGEIGRLQSAIAEARTRISGLEIERLRLVEARREEAITQLRDLQYAEIELEERRLGLTERLARLDVRAPVAGTVFGSRVAALQSVVQAAEPMMFVVPGDQPLQVSARIDPTDIDQVFVGQQVSLVFSAFSQRSTPRAPGTVVRISADAAFDEATGLSFYEAVVKPDAATLDPDLADRLLPGMPVEVHLRTEDRTPLSYLTQPLTVYFSRALREG